MCLGPLWIQLVWDSLRFLDLYVYFICQIKQVFFHYFFKYVFNFLIFLFCFWHSYDSDVGTFGVGPGASHTILVFFFNSFFFLLFWLNAYFFLMFQIIDLNPSFLPFTVGSLWIFISLSLTFISSFVFAVPDEFSEHVDNQCFDLCI